MKLNIMLLRPTAPRWTGERCPIKAVSTVDNKGTEILLIIFGVARLSISLFSLDIMPVQPEHKHTIIRTPAVLKGAE